MYILSTAIIYVYYNSLLLGVEYTALVDYLMRAESASAVAGCSGGALSEPIAISEQYSSLQYNSALAHMDQAI